MKKTLVRITAKTLLLTLTYQLVFPLYSYALTTGPSQPEVQSFEPVGTTEMVNMFTGDFNYNLPLLDVEGYPVNISYHSGINMEQEASWVGLGWNINPGEINRTVRGLPDDFNGEKIEKELKIEKEKNFRIGSGVALSLELTGYDARVSLGLGTYIAFNNYRGTSVGINADLGISMSDAYAGIGLGVGSQTGADLDVNASYTASTKVTQDVGAGLGVNGGAGFNSRSGLSASLGMSVSTNAKNLDDKFKKTGNSRPNEKQKFSHFSYGSAIPIGMQNYVPVITNESVLKSFQVQTRIGGEIWSVFPSAHLYVQKSTLEFLPDGSRNGYGYMYLENSGDKDILDFSRDKEGYYNNTLKNLPLASMTYDIYSVNGQGTGGSFRPFRNDIGSIHDPLVAPPASTSNGVNIEAGIGNLFEVGTDLKFYENESKSGPWKKLPFRGNEKGSLYEKLFFKQGGELTYNNQQVPHIYNSDPVYVAEDEATLKGHGKSVKGQLPAKYGNARIFWNGTTIDRTSRANLISYTTAEEASKDDVSQSKKLTTYYGSHPTPAYAEIDRYSSSGTHAKAHHVSEFTQTLPDGRRYVYGLPALNHASREVTFSVSPGNANVNNGLVRFDAGSDTRDGSRPTREKFYSSTVTPAYAHSYLLTSVLSTDYADVLGDGPTDDDPGTFVKFNYALMDNDYRWRAPSCRTIDSAQYNPGFWTDLEDDKGNYVVGSRQQWYLRSIESKNYIAEFYVSKRADGKGVTNAVLPSNSTLQTDSLNLKGTKSDSSYSFKLDSIKLYNKHDRYLNGTNAVPVKTVYFKYDYSLCPGIPNTTGSQGGKLTLQKIFIKYGKSDKNLMNPYVFTYNNFNAAYSYTDKDRWGNYKKNDPGANKYTNYEFPYTKQKTQSGDVLDIDKAPWNLTDIKLPSGGKIHIDYESDDYAYVQNKRTMQMNIIAGVGNGTAFDPKKTLYESLNDVNTYVYFRRSAYENPNLSFKDNYLEGTDELYYSMNVELAGYKRYEQVHGYAKVESMGICSGDSTQYGYIKLKREWAGKRSKAMLHPATLAAINLGRFYMPHVMYPGMKNGDGNDVQVMKAMLASAGELVSIFQNPNERFIEKKQYAQNIQPEKSWIRLHVPKLTKKGGDIRVKQLTLNDSWKQMSSNPDSGVYGKVYDYTIEDERFGLISSGVASYEPMIGGDENPFRKPVPYTAEAGRWLPSIEFYQEEPFGESFFPGPVVGYSKVTVKSIHADKAQSAQSEEEHRFYTAKDFPIEVDYVEKDDPPVNKTKTLRKKFEEVKVFQGYVLRFNDMHGKARSVHNYNVKTDGTNRKRELVSGVTYNYQQDNTGRLNNEVTALIRQRGTHNNYTIAKTKLGEEVDFTVDSREKKMRSYTMNININLNVFLVGVFPVPIPTMFTPDKEEEQQFHSLVSTKIIQKYGILKSVETFDHGAKTVKENVIYDSETGTVLMTKTNNEFNDGIYDLSYPAYWAYEGMGPGYTNVGYEEENDSLVIYNLSFDNYNGNTPSYYGKLHFKNKARFTPGDELLISYQKNNTTYTTYVWVLDEHWASSAAPPGMPVPFPYSYYGPNAMPPYQTFNTYDVVPRHMFNNSSLQWPGLAGGDVVNNVTVKIIRSGRRNQLNQVVQQASFSVNPYINHINDILGGNTNAFNNLLSVSTQEFLNVEAPYGTYYGDSLAHQYYDLGNPTPMNYNPNMLPMNITVGGDVRKVYNPYVLGYLGDFKAIKTYAYLKARKYNNNNIRYDGSFVVDPKFWNNTNGVGSSKVILAKNSTATTSNLWKATSNVIKHDINGNIIEEQDANGQFSSAQYGYNKALPVAVASNVRQRSFCFDGFEEYKMLVPVYLRSLYLNSYYYHTPFAPLFTNTGTTTSNYKQSYIVPNLTNGGFTVSNEAFHSGNYSLKVTSAQSANIRIHDPEEENNGYHKEPPQGIGVKTVKAFSFENKRKYIVQLWLKPFSGTPSVSGLTVTTGSGAYPFAIKTQNIEGWYLAECSVNLANNSQVMAQLNLPANLYIDDIRFIPTDASMKSFVYDPLTFRLQAQLDENHFTTFYEYDPEGLLVRVKKETERGVMTISESRRSNAKK